MFGCSSLLGLTAEDRRKELRKHNICYNCGEKRTTITCRDPKEHKCVKVKEEIQCHADNCNWNSFTCYHGQIDPEVRRKVKERFGIELRGLNFNPNQQTNCPKDVVAEQSLPSNVQNRIDDLQKGLVSKQMTDTEKKWKVRKPVAS